MRLPNKCLVDTNVAVNANLAIDPAKIPDEIFDCVQACVDAIDHVIKTKGFVLDRDGEIYREYLNNLCLSGNKGMGNAFMKWVHDNRWRLPDTDIVTITKSGDSYDEFPSHEALSDFDKSDRKFVAVANAHEDKPPILQATDSKWWGWQEALAQVGITVHFLCPEYVKDKYAKKMNS